MFVDRLAYVFWVQLHHTKTIQFGERTLWVPICGLKGHPLDIIAAYDRMVALIPAGPDDHLFAVPSGRVGEFVPMTHDFFVTSTKDCVAAAGLNPGLVAGHSYRRGGAAFAHHCKVPVAFIKLQGDWRSNAYLAYISVPDEDKVLVSQAMWSRLVVGDLGSTILGGARVQV